MSNCMKCGEEKEFLNSDGVCVKCVRGESSKPVWPIVVCTSVAAIVMIAVVWAVGGLSNEFNMSLNRPAALPVSTQTPKVTPRLTPTPEPTKIDYPTRSRLQTHGYKNQSVNDV